MSDRFGSLSVSMFRVTRCWQQLAAERMEAYGLKSGCALYLAILLRQEEGVTAAWLASQCGRDKADVSRSVAAMEQKGFLTRCGSQRYRAVLRLTEKGRQAAQDVNRAAEDIMMKAGEGLSDAEREAFRNSFSLIADNITRICEQGMTPDLQEKEQ